MPCFLYIFFDFCTWHTKSIYIYIILYYIYIILYYIYIILYYISIYSIYIYIYIYIYIMTKNTVFKFWNKYFAVLYRSFVNILN